MTVFTDSKLAVIFTYLLPQGFFDSLDRKQMIYFSPYLTSFVVIFLHELNHRLLCRIYILKNLSDLTWTVRFGVNPADEILYNNYKIRCAICSVCPTQLRSVMDVYQFAHSGADTSTPLLRFYGLAI